MQMLSCAWCDLIQAVWMQLQQLVEWQDFEQVVLPQVIAANSWGGMPQW